MLGHPGLICLPITVKQTKGQYSTSLLQVVIPEVTGIQRRMALGCIVISSQIADVRMKYPRMLD